MSTSNIKIKRIPPPPPVEVPEIELTLRMTKKQAILVNEIFASVNGVGPNREFIDFITESFERANVDYDLDSPMVEGTLSLTS